MNLDVADMPVGVNPITDAGKALFEEFVAAGKIIGYDSVWEEGTTIKYDEVLYLNESARDEHMAASREMAEFVSSGVQLISSSSREATEEDIIRLSF